MNKKNFNLFFSIAIVLVLSLYFVFAVPGAPTTLEINNNVTPLYDEGNFFVNWTVAVSGNTTYNYTIYIFADNVYSTTAENNSDTGYSVSGFSEANYTFIVEAWNATGVGINSTTPNNISMYVDTTPPTFTTIPNNVSQDYLVANVGATFVWEDGIELSMIYINDTSNFTMVNATGVLTNNTPLFADSYALNVTINDTVGNINWTIFTVVVNKINPDATLWNNETWTETYPAEVMIGLNETNSGDGDLTYKIYRDNVTDIGTSETISLAVGTHNYTLNTTGGQNYTSNASLHTENLVISQNAGICGVYFNATSPITFPETFIVYTNCSTAYTLKQNTTTISNATEVVSGTGAFNFSVQRTDTANYSDTYNDEEFQVAKNADICGVEFNETSPLEYPGTFLVWSNCSTANYLTKNATVIGNNTEQTLSVGAYNFSTNRTDSANYSDFYSEREFRIVDTTKPAVSSPVRPVVNGNYSDSIVLNVSITDSVGVVLVWFNITNSSGMTNGTYVATNPSTNPAGYWNATLNTSLFPDGTYNVTVYANDTANNLNSSISSGAFTIDNTNPVATFTCSPSTLGNGADTICTCTGTDTGGVGVNDSLTTAAVTITSNSTFGTFTTGTNNCTITDNAGNTHNATGTYTVASDAATDRGSSSSKTPMRWTGTFVINEEQFSEGNTKQVAVNKRLRFKVKNINHHLGILELTGTTAKIEVSSTPQEATLSVGDTRKFDVSEDGYYDLVVTLNSILEGKADLTIKYISELITTESEVGEQEKEDAAEVAESEEEIQESSSIFKKWWFWLVVVLIVVGIGYYVKKNKR